MHLFVSAVLLVLCSPFIVAEVVESFSTCSSMFFKEEPPEIKGVLEHSTSQDNNRYKLICQKYEGEYRYATLYDISAKIPLFSAYKFTAVNKNPPHIPWMIEPQLNTLDGSMSDPGENQAADRDYWKQKKQEWERGHLFPNGHAPDEITAESTYTLTNTVPQNTKFNKGSWRSMEQSVRLFMETNCRDENNPDDILAYVLTGAVPGDKRLNNRVNIPSHMWTVFCCFNPKTLFWESKAHWAENKDEKNPIPIPDKTLGILEEFLGNKFKQSSLFSRDCNQFFDVKDYHPNPWFLSQFQRHFVHG
ncbi:endonuclease domain-containing 1 protein-like [Pimephales promelas]|uniref:endonuclease domain-containing 1 protein-like n=1 Tax=Pimephales promelas TaxID=90988 RepID=UPI0019554E33|nr:endonuclease domain-containing 1 protein-like [Pimephales promelas]KAG1926310.1 endonuclease domain-containing 1 protein-like [Pimephales promelas]